MTGIFMDKWGSKIVTGEEIAYKPSMIALNNIRQAIEMLHKHIKNKSLTIVHCDVDGDGIGSGYIMNSFLREMGMQQKMRMAINKTKEHGIAQRHADAFNKIGTEFIIILDSSTNELEYIKQFNCDVLVIDHHEIIHDELSGNTAGGKYVIVNNMIDGNSTEIKQLATTVGKDLYIDDYVADERMSCGLVIYELLRVYCNIFTTEAILENLMLYQWVGITLFTDAILLASDRNQWYIENTVHSSNIEKSLQVMMKEINKYKLSLDKSFINFSFAPLLNKAIRAGHSSEALDIVISRPYDIKNLMKYDRIQTLAIEAAIGKETEDEIIKGNTKNIEYSSFIMNDITDLTDSDGNEVLPSYSGVIAIKLCSQKRKNCVTYKIVDGLAVGSFRGRYNYTDYRKYFSDYSSDIYAQGHKQAFGFKVKPDVLYSILEKLPEIEKEQSNKFYLTAGDIPDNLHGEYHIDNFDEFKRAGNFWKLAMANSKLSSDESINIVTALTETKLIETRGKLYIYDIMGLKCKAFTQLTTPLVNIYIEYTKEVEIFAKNSNI